MRIYLAGAIFGKSDAECKDWRKTATEAFKAAGAEVLDPMSRDYRGIEDSNVSKLVHDDLADIASCGAVFVKADAPSWGTAMELVYASQEGCSVIAWGVGDKVSPWLQYHCDYHYKTLEEGIQAVINVIKDTQ